MPVMERLDFQLPEFTRVSWVSDQARQVWESRLERIKQIGSILEWRSVAAGIRQCNLLGVFPEDLVELSEEWMSQGLWGLPLEILRVPNIPYANRLSSEGRPIFRYVVGKPELLLQFKQAYLAGDHDRIGSFLGFPKCCREAFQKTWVEQKYLDTTWPMAIDGSPHPSNLRDLTVTGIPEANLLWKWIGIRAVPHLPCSFSCQETQKLGQQLIALGHELGYAQEMDWLMEILSWSVEWSALHGIAEIKTPILKISTCTDATATQYVVRREGSRSPQEAAQGLHFPFQTPRHPRLTQSNGFQRGLVHSLDTEILTYKPIVDLAVGTLRFRASRGQGSGPESSSLANTVLDLGSGNGSLSKQIAQRYPEAIPFAVHRDLRSIVSTDELSGQEDVPIPGDLMTQESLWDTDRDHDRRYGLVVLRLASLFDVDEDKVEAFKASLKRHCDQILIYVLDEDLQACSYETLAAMAGSLGFVTTAMREDAMVSLAKVLQPVAH